MNNRQIIVGLGERSYPIIIGSNLFRTKDILASMGLRGRRFVVVTNDVVGPMYLSAVEDWFLSAEKNI